MLPRGSKSWTQLHISTLALKELWAVTKIPEETRGRKSPAENYTQEGQSWEDCPRILVCRELKERIPILLIGDLEPMSKMYLAVSECQREVGAGQQSKVTLIRMCLYI